MVQRYTWEVEEGYRVADPEGKWVAYDDHIAAIDQDREEREDLWAKMEKHLISIEHQNEKGCRWEAKYTVEGIDRYFCGETPAEAFKAALKTFAPKNPKTEPEDGPGGDSMKQVDL